MMKQGSVPTLHNEVRKKMRSTKHNWIEERCDAIEKGMKAGRAKRPTRLRHTQLYHQNQLAEEAAIDDKDSKLTTDKDGLLMRWAWNCGDMYNSELDTDGSILQTNRSSNESQDSPPVLEGEIEAAVKTGK